MSTTRPSGEIWFKAQRALRTAVQVAVTLAGILATFVLVAPQVLDAIADVLPDATVAWLAAVIAGAAAVSAAISRVMAIPAVDRWLTKFGLGSTPRSAAKTGTVPPSDGAARAIASETDARDGSA